MPSKCSDANWGVSFDHEGWSTCGNDNLFITAFYRSDPHRKENPISLLEGARCCSATLEFSIGQGECTRANWWGTLDRFVH